MLQFGWSPLVVLFSSPPLPFLILWWLYQEHQLQFVSPSLSCSSFSFQFRSKFQVLTILIAFFQFYSVVSRDGKIYNSASSLLFLLIMTRSGRLVEIRWSVGIPRSQRSLYVSFSRTDSGLCIYHFFARSNFNFLHNSQCITLPTHSCLVLYSFYANLLLSLIMWLIVSSLSPHNLHLMFCYVFIIIIIYSF